MLAHQEFCYYRDENGSALCCAPNCECLPRRIQEIKDTIASLKRTAKPEATKTERRERFTLSEEQAIWFIPMDFDSHLAFTWWPNRHDFKPSIDALYRWQWTHKGNRLIRFNSRPGDDPRWDQFREYCVEGKMYIYRCTYVFDDAGGLLRKEISSWPKTEINSRHPM